MVTKKLGIGSQEEFPESRARGFAQMWWVAENYKIERLKITEGNNHPSPVRSQGVIRPYADGKSLPLPASPENVTWYMPLAHRELPGEFAKLANGNTQNLLRFVQRYGHLGYAESFNWLELIGASSQRLHNPKIQGDPVAWVLSHA